MLTYRSFTTPLDLLNYVIERYCITAPEGMYARTRLFPFAIVSVHAGLPEEAVAAFKKNKVTPIRLRVFNMLRGWIRDFWADFKCVVSCTQPTVPNQ